MAKKSKSQLNIILYGVAILLAIVSICMMVVNGSALAKDGETAYILTGLQATFGYTEETLIGNAVYTQFSFMNLLTYILLAVGIVLVILKMLKVAKSDAINWVAIIVFVAAGILYFMMPNFVVYGKAWSSLVDAALDFGASKTAMVGAIVGGISSILAAATLVAQKLVGKK